MDKKAFRFLEEEHEYYLGDQRLPSVTEIIKSSSDGTDYSNIPEGILKRAAEIGNEVHKTVELYHKGESDLTSGDQSADRYLVGYQKFIDSDVYEHFRSEHKMYCECHMFAGTVDLIGFVNDKPAVLDVKTTSGKNIASWNLQTAAYKHLAENELETELENRYVIHLGKNGSFSLIKCSQSDAWDRFLRFYKMWKAENSNE